MDKIRKRIKERIDDLDMTYAEVSRRIGRNHAYIQQFLKRGIPSELDPKIAKKLAFVLEIPEGELMDENIPTNSGSQISLAKGVIAVPEYDLAQLRNSDGIFALTPISSDWYFRRDLLEGMGAHPEKTIIVRAEGDSMSSSIKPGEPLFVDTSRTDLSEDGTYLLKDGKTVLVRRIERVPGSQPQEIVLIADSPNSESFRIQVNRLKALGRVVGAVRLIP